MNDFKWSDAEKKIARGAFDAALNRECAAIMRKVKEMAARTESPDDLWDLHDYLTEQRRGIADRYDYRYSRLIFLFAAMLREKWIDKSDLAGLGGEKIEAIERIATA